MSSLNDRISLFKIAAALFILSVLLYLPSLGNGYVGWDDGLILDDSRIRSLSPASLISFLAPGTGWNMSYQPLRTLAYALVYAISGTAPVSFLVLNILLYAAVVLLYYLLVRRILYLWAPEFTERRSAGVALVAALIFALHPLHVETVSWLLGGKMTLMGMFFLGSLLSYVEFRAGGRFRWLAGSFLLYLCALAGQPSALSLPLVLLAFELVFPPPDNHTRANSLPRRLITAGVFFLPMLAAAVQLVFFSSVSHTLAANSSPLARVFTLPLLWERYLLKFTFPLDICGRYPFGIPSRPPYLSGTLGLVLLGGIGWLTVRSSVSRRLAIFGLAFAAVTLLPTSGLVPTSTLMADRYAFLPGMGLALVAGLLLVRLYDFVSRYGPRPRNAVLAVMTLAAIVFGGITLRRQLDWRDPFTFWGRVLEVYPGHDLATFNLAEAHQRAGQFGRAEQLYRRATEINPAYGDAWANLAVLKRAGGDSLAALAMLQRAAELRPDRGAVWVNLGISFAGLGQDSLALQAFGRAIERRDKWEWQGYYNRAKLLLSLGEQDRALEDIAKAARTWPGRFSSEAWLDLGRTLEGAGKVPLAVELMSRGRLEPAFNFECRRMLGNLQLLDNRPEEAVRSLESALRENPGDYRTLLLLGSAGYQGRRYDRAVEYFCLALGAAGADSARTLHHIALSLSAAGKNAEALDTWRRALEMDPAFLDGWISLGLFQRNLGHEAKAVLCLNRALELCGETPALDGARERLRGLLVNRAGE